MSRLLRSLTLAALGICAASTARAQTLEGGVSADLRLTRVVANLFQPTAAEFTPDGRLVILQQNGEILVWTGSGAPIPAGTMPVNFDGGEQGLLGLAIDPEFATTNRLYLYYSASGAPTNDRNRVAYVTLDPATNEVDVAGRVDIVTGIYGPANHNGGGLAFGPDGYLYVGTGDRGCNCNCAPGRANNYFGTCLTNLSGKILRVDREGGIPATNPLVNVASVAACGATPDACRTEPNAGTTGAPRTEIYNWGFRNAWRFAFDAQTGWMWIGDVGEVTWEEITISKGPGVHHGWPLREAAHGDAPATCLDYTPDAVGPCNDPVFEYAHSENPSNAASVTGGVFSNHCSWPEGWRGRYWFADYVFNRVWTLTPNAARDGVDGERTNIARNAGGPVHFFEGLDGAIYVLSLEGGAISRIEPVNPASCGAPDAGVAPDASEVVDTGVVLADAGAGDAAVNADAASGSDAAGLDATIADAGGISERPSDGCGCTATEGASRSGLGLVALGLALVARRRR